MDFKEIAGRTVVTVPEAGEVLGIQRASAYRAVHRGDIPVIKIGRRLLVPVPKLREMLGLDPEQVGDVGTA